MTTSARTILVTGATGAQGGATARALLAKGYSVRFLTRRPDSSEAREISALGGQAIAGEFDDAKSLQAAIHGVSGVFSVQLPDFSGDGERRHGFALIEAACRNNVEQFVHTSVSCTGKHEGFPRWQEGYWSKKYWTDKWDVEEAVRGAGFRCWTVLRPAFMMENFTQPKAAHMFPHLVTGEIATALRAKTRMQLIAADDIGSFARAAFDEPEAYQGLNIELAAEALSMAEVASILTRVTGKKVVSAELTPQQAVEKGLFGEWVRSQEWSNEVGYCADIQGLAQYDIELTSFEQWARTYRSRIDIRN